MFSDTYNCLILSPVHFMMTCLPLFINNTIFYLSRLCISCLVVYNYNRTANKMRKLAFEICLFDGV